MAAGLRNTLKLKNIPTLYHLGVVGNLSDGQLLESFLAGPEEAAQAGFAALVDRHGPMVLHICQQILGNPDDAEDAFQATFLVLVHRAGSVRKRDSVASWLYGIAYRVARRSRADAARRRKHERRWAAVTAVGHARPPVEPECWPELHDELGRLPDRYREPIVLCYLQGLSTEAAAQRLGCAQGTVMSRLARAREKLRKRLTRRGMVLPTALLAADPVEAAMKGAVPPGLAHSIVQTAVRYATGEAAAQAGVAATVAQLVRGVQRTMFFTKLSVGAAAIVTIATLLAGAGALFQFQKTPDQGKKRIQAPTVRQAAAPVRKDLKKTPGLRDSTVVPNNLAWSEVPREEWAQVLEMLAARSRANFEKIKTWKGSYRMFHQYYLPKNSVARLPVTQGKIEPLMQEFDVTVKFALDSASGSIYRDTETRSMRFVRPGTNEPVSIPGVGPASSRSILTPDIYVEFDPTHGLIPNGHRQAVRFPAKEGGNRAANDPREFYEFSRGYPYGLWAHAEANARRLRGQLGEEQLNETAQRLAIGQAEGPGGRWYWEQTRSGFGTQDTYITYIWSPQVGYNPVVRFSSREKPDGGLSDRTEWHWRLVADTFVPAVVKFVAYQEDGTLDNQRDATLDDCVVNQPLGPHRFDYEGLGLKDGDVINDSAQQAQYILKDGKLVRQANN